MKRRLTGVACLFAVVISVLSGCSSTPTQSSPDLLGMLQGLVSDVAVQKLVDYKSRHESSVRALAYLDKFAASDLNFVALEMKAVARLAKHINLPLESRVTLTSTQKQEVAAIVLDAESRWLNRYGWMRLSPKETDDGYGNENPTLFTSEYLWLLSRLGFLEGDFRTRWRDALKKQVKEMELQPGLYDRYPVALRGADVKSFSHDETLGLILIDSLFNYELGFAKDQYEFGKAHDYVYDNSAWSAVDVFDRPVISDGQPVSKLRQLAFTQRYGALIEIIRRTGGAPESPASDLVLCAGLLTAFQESCSETSVPIMAVLQASVLKNKTETLDGCIHHMNYIARQKFRPGNTCGGRNLACESPFCAMTEIYFRSDHPNYRLAKILASAGG